MTARGHAMHLMREAPALFARIARAVLSFAATLLGAVWLYPGGAWLSLCRWSRRRSRSPRRTSRGGRS
ncbi:hypothetical protein [Sorangium cellulosum]|nr:hypothetical protein [Sorangium cellulosum]